MNQRNKIDYLKTIEVMLYITQSVTDIYKALKILYFANKAHLQKYGRLIAEDTFSALKYGPVPQSAYDLIKAADGRDIYPTNEPIETIFYVPDRNNVIPQRKPRLEFLSESDIECLDEAIKENKNLSFGELKKKSHDKAWKKADQNGEMDLDDIIMTLPDGKEILEYLKS